MQQGGGSYMSIGYGQGPDKASQAVEQALHHPLLESIPIESATGIIANFTGDSSLSFYEVAEALTHMQERTGHQAEIIPGLMTDDRLVDRCPGDPDHHRSGRPFGQQVDASAHPGCGQTHPDSHPRMANQPAYISIEQDNSPAQDRNNALTNLDMPAFIRKRYRTNW